MTGSWLATLLGTCGLVTTSGSNPHPICCHSLDLLFRDWQLIKIPLRLKSLRPLAAALEWGRQMELSRECDAVQLRLAVEVLEGFYACNERKCDSLLSIIKPQTAPGLEPNP